ncbi:hypothetical protein fugu_000750 [Takifugu bimaculatus]|uniref:Uncharacterized protein n=1 Tax=Takifugu bimaculatus TaxID=433685 RepID=A0A4Z2CHT7_9TELE|nr:hypothetical protein fugu_000750 [Takifugu bimaculatus]
MVNEHQHGESPPWFLMATQQEGREAMRDMKIPNKGEPEELRGPGKNSQGRDMLGYTFFTSFLAWVIQHASVWLHCLEELQGLVGVMAAFTLIHRGATSVPPSEGSDSAAVRPRPPTAPSLLRHEDKRTPRKEQRRNQSNSGGPGASGDAVWTSLSRNSTW